MLYFTFSSGRTLGIFSGRFAFKLVKKDDGDSEALVNHIERLAIHNVGPTIAHEFAHHAVAIHSTVNKGLIGSRFFARINFARGRHEEVRRYYVRRTLYFSLAYRFHEALVDRLVRQRRQTLRVCEIRAVRSLDEHIKLIARIAAHSVAQFNWSLPSILGTLTTKEFGVILAVESTDGGTQLREASGRSGFSGVFNAAFQPSRQDHPAIRVIKAIHRKVNIEALASRLGIALDDNAFFLWSCDKLVGEFRAISAIFEPDLRLSASASGSRLLDRAYQSNRTPMEYFYSYLSNILPFAMEFQGLDKVHIFSDIYTLIDEVMDCVTRESFDDMSPRSRELLTVAGRLFFYHGN